MCYFKADTAINYLPIIGKNRDTNAGTKQVQLFRWACLHVIVLWVGW